MGEYAEMMLEGDACSTCGEYLGDGDGFPRQCASCRRDEEREDRPSIRWHRINREADLKGIAKFVRKGATVNTYNGPRTDKNGNPFFFLGYDRKPDSDWGRYEGHSAAVWCKTDELAAAAEKEIRRALGWQVEGNAP